ncbi:hypothetical protein BC834DRAFT_882405, partial [Gloeopeniophorella convolvens]
MSGRRWSPFHATTAVALAIPLNSSPGHARSSPWPPLPCLRDTFWIPGAYRTASNLPRANDIETVRPFDISMV